MYLNFFIIPYLYKAQHISNDTPPIIRSLKLHWKPLVSHTWKVVCTCSWWILSGTVYLTTSIPFTFYLVTLRPIYFPYHLFTTHVKFTSFPSRETPNATPVYNTKNNYISIFLSLFLFFFNRLVAQTVYTGCTRINYESVSLKKFNKYLHYDTSGTE